MEISARESSIKILSRLEESNELIKHLLERSFSGGKQSFEDRKLKTEIVNGVIRRKIELEYILNHMVKKGLNNLPKMIRIILMIGIYQLEYLDRIPAYSAVNESVELARKYGHSGTVRLVNAVLRNYLRMHNGRTNKIPEALDRIERIMVKYSMPLFILRKWINEFGEEKTLLILESISNAPKVSIRANTLKISREQLVRELSEAHEGDYEPEVSILTKDGIVLKRQSGIWESGDFRRGNFIFQDEASQFICEVLESREGDTILDACAAPGTKTTQISQYINNNGLIIACDSNKTRMKLIRENCERLGVTSVHLLCCDLTNFNFRDVKFDRILIDAPCSCSGIFRRHPELKYRITPERIKRLSDLQLGILHNVSRYLKKDGIIVYSTCSLEKEENESVIENFLGDRESFCVERCEWIEDRIERGLSGVYRIFPYQYGTDGFSFTILKNKGK